MKPFALALFVLTLLFSSCQNQNVVTPDEQNGKVKLSFDKTTIPDDVTLITALLTRDGFNPVTGSMNILSPNSAEITLENLAAGIWHLKIEALDVNNTILYSGETEIEIIANTTTPVALTLTPSGSQTGSVHITVAWGITPTDWLDHPNNPILTKQGYFYDTWGVALPHVLYDEGTYKMWYTGLGPSNGSAYILYATSSDGVNWTYHEGAVLLPGNFWDQTSVSVGTVIKENDTFKMYYNGFNTSSGRWSIGIALSNDGINWEKHPNPILEGIDNTWEEQITAHHVELIGDKYYLYYTGRTGLLNHKIGFATSFDGINWTRYEGNPILIPDQNWEGNAVAYPSIISDQGIYKMVYCGLQNGVGNALGIATSSDGISWQKSNNNPIFYRSNSINNYINIAYPMWLKTNNQYLLYYAGKDEEYVWEICLATKNL